MVYVFLANGFEEVEAVTPLDILRRAKIAVKSVGIGGVNVTSTRGIAVTADIGEEDVLLNEELEAVVLPGGMPGASNLAESETVRRALIYASEKGKIIAALCAAPTVPAKYGLLDGKKATCHPDFNKELNGAIYSAEPVVTDGNFVTGRGMGVSIEFSLAIVESLCGKNTAESINKSLLCAR